MYIFIISKSENVTAVCFLHFLVIIAFLWRRILTKMSFSNNNNIHMERIDNEKVNAKETNDTSGDMRVRESVIDSIYEKVKLISKNVLWWIVCFTIYQIIIFGIGEDYNLKKINKWKWHFLFINLMNCDTPSQNQYQKWYWSVIKIMSTCGSTSSAANWQNVNEA